MIFIKCMTKCETLLHIVIYFTLSLSFCVVCDIFSLYSIITLYESVDLILKNLDLHEIFTILSFHCRFPIVLHYFSHIWINSLYVFLSSVWNMFLKRVLTDARTNLCVLILSLSWLLRVTLQTSSRCCIFFNILIKHFSNHFSIFGKTLRLFHRLNNNAFYCWTGTLDFYF